MKIIYLLPIIMLSLVGCKPSNETMVSVGEKIVKDTLKDPDSAKFESFYRQVTDGQGYVCGTVNAKNSYGGYIGKKSYYVYFEYDGKNVTTSTQPVIINDPSDKKMENWHLFCQK